MSYIN